MPSAGRAGPVVPRGDRPGRRLSGSRGRGSVAAEGLAAGAAGFGGAVGVEGEFRGEAVDADLVVVFTEQDEVGQAGLAAVGAVDDVVDLASGRRFVAAAGPGAVPVAEDDQAAQVVGDARDLAGVQGQARRVVGGAELAG